MARYVDIEAVGIGKAKRELFVVPEYADGWNNAIDIFEQAPTADVEEVKHSRWERLTDQYGGRYNGMFECTNCYNVERVSSAHCPACGAKMDGGKAE